MSGLSNQNQKMEEQLGGKEVRRISEILKAEPSTFSGTSITINTVLIIKACSWFKNVIIVMQAGAVARF